MSAPAFQPLEPEPPKKKPKAKKDAGKPPAVTESSLRSALRDALGKDKTGLDFIVATLKEACEPTVKVRIENQPCLKCGCPHVRHAEIPRFKDAVDLAIKVMDQIEGRPGVAEGAGQQIVVQRIVVGVDE